jgi:hypothetical protein
MKGNAVIFALILCGAIVGVGLGGDFASLSSTDREVYAMSPP